MKWKRKTHIKKKRNKGKEPTLHRKGQLPSVKHQQFVDLVVRAEFNNKAK